MGIPISVRMMFFPCLRSDVPFARLNVRFFFLILFVLPSRFLPIILNGESFFFIIRSFFHSSRTGRIYSRRKTLRSVLNMEVQDNGSIDSFKTNWNILIFSGFQRKITLFIKRKILPFRIFPGRIEKTGFLKGKERFKT